MYIITNGNIERPIYPSSSDSSSVSSSISSMMNGDWKKMARHCFVKITFILVVLCGLYQVVVNGRVKVFGK